MQTKICPTCKEDKPVVKFYASGTSAGTQRHCIACTLKGKKKSYEEMRMKAKLYDELMKNKIKD